MANSLFEKIESDALSKIDSIDAEFDKFSALDKEINEICDLYQSGAFRDEDEFELALSLAYKRFNVTVAAYQIWCQRQDELDNRTFAIDDDVFAHAGDYDSFDGWD